MRRYTSGKRVEIFGSRKETKIQSFFMPRLNNVARGARSQVYLTVGEWVEMTAGMGKIAMDYFEGLFKPTDIRDLGNALDMMDTVVTENMNNKLTRRITEDEVRTVLFAMHPEKAPGLDGMTALFYQRFWGIVKHDTTRLVGEFFRHGKFDERLNETNIFLIPKKERPERMTKLRQISL